MIYRSIVLGLLIGIYMLVYFGYELIKDIHDYHSEPYFVPKNEEDERRVTLHCHQLADTEEEYELCKRLGKRYEAPLIVDPRGTRGIGELVEEGQGPDMVG